MVHLRNRCLTCGGELDIEEVVCTNCGSSETEEIVSTECIHCGWQDELSLNEPCPQCGEEMQEIDD